jgi:hypothetical protein
MIKKTFSHTDGISENTEKVIWENGISDWDDFLEKHHEINFLPQSKIDKIKSEIEFSKQNLENNNIRYFKEKLDPKQHWRLSNYGKVGYVDIETTGLSRWSHDITMIGIFDGENAKSYVAGIDLEGAKDHLDEFDIIVTFNGKQFDLPFIEHKFCKKYDCIHLDLRFMLKELGFCGGLKKIEKALGISRPDEIKDVDGFEAVRLWRRYMRGDEEALNTLLEYNREDIVNLKFLLEYYLSEKRKQLNL